MSSKQGGEIKSERETAARDREIYTLAVVECRTQEEIGAKFGLCDRQIRRIIAEEDRLIRAQCPEHIARIKDEQTQQLQFIRAEAMQAWERSKRDAESETTKDIEFGESKIPGIEKSKTVKGQVGDPSYLAIAMKAMEDIRKIWGVDAAKEVKLSGQFGFLIGGDMPAPPREEVEQKLLKRIDVIVSKLKPANGETHVNGTGGNGNGHVGSNGLILEGS